MGDRPLRSPTHRWLGGPLPHLLPNGTHARPRPPQLYAPEDALRGGYGGLPGVSTGYLPVGGWLHTRYAPVRHSRPPEGGLPFDLHVLGLPLAFILSQDQTLHCIIAVLNVFLNLGFRCVFLAYPTPRRLAEAPVACFSSSCWPQTFKERKTLNSLSPPLVRFAGAKVLLSCKPTSTFFYFFAK